MKKQKKNKIPPFPLKLYDLVNNENNSHIITWTEDGLSFIIKDIHKFIYEILPKKFDTKLFSSFNRQLNSYGFTKTKSNQSCSNQAEIFELAHIATRKVTPTGCLATVSSHTFHHHRL